VEEALKKPIARQEIRKSLRQILDLEKLTTRISVAAASPRDLVALKKSLWPLPEIEVLLKEFQASCFDGLKSSWDNLQDVAGLIDRAILDEPPT